MATALPLAFILPSLCYIKLESGRLFSKKKIYALLLAVFGCSVTIIGTLKVLSVMIWSEHANGSNCSHGHELDYCNIYPKNVSSSTLIRTTSPATISLNVSTTRSSPQLFRSQSRMWTWLPGHIYIYNSVCTFTFTTIDLLLMILASSTAKQIDKVTWWITRRRRSNENTQNTDQMDLNLCVIIIK